MRIASLAVMAIALSTLAISSLIGTALAALELLGRIL